jgi:CHAD domain-containing protein
MAYRFAVATTNPSQITPAVLTVRLLALLAKVSGRASKQDVHLLRTTVRRLEVQLGKPPAKLAKALKKLRRKAGEVRDLDVHLGLLKSPLPVDATARGKNGHQAEPEAQKELRRVLTDRRERRLKSLCKQVAEATPLLQQRLPALAESSAPATPAAADVHRRAGRARDRFLQWTRSIPANPERLHRLRINTKKLRYSLEPLAAFDESADLVAKFKTVQDAIGTWHDWATLEQLAGRYLDPSEAAPLCKVLASRSARQYQQAIRAVQSARNVMQGRKPVASIAEIRTQPSLRRAG